jgi:hypothetical protein
VISLSWHVTYELQLLEHDLIVMDDISSEEIISDSGMVLQDKLMETDKLLLILLWLQVLLLVLPDSDQGTSSQTIGFVVQVLPQMTDLVQQITTFDEDRVIPLLLTVPVII